MGLKEPTNITVYSLGIFCILLVLACSGPDVVQKISLPDSTGVSVLDLTKANYEVEYKESSAGAFIESIDGVRNRNNTYWIFYVNDTAGTVAADRYILKQGDHAEWLYISGY